MQWPPWIYPDHIQSGYDGSLGSAHIPGMASSQAHVYAGPFLPRAPAEPVGKKSTSAYGVTSATVIGGGRTPESFPGG